MAKPCRDCGTVETPQGGRCADCRRRYQQEYREQRKETHPDYFKDYYRANRERRKLESREYARAHADDNRRRVREWAKANPEKAREAHRRKRKLRPEHYREMWARWAQKNPQSRKNATKRWQERNPDKVRANWQRRRAREYDAFVAEVILQEIWDRDEGRCGICGKSIGDGPVHLDHILPLAAGGTHEPDNVQLAHPFCNQSKGARRPDELSPS